MVKQLKIFWIKYQFLTKQFLKFTINFGKTLLFLFTFKRKSNVFIEDIFIIFFSFILFLFEKWFNLQNDFQKLFTNCVALVIFVDLFLHTFNRFHIFSNQFLDLYSWVFVKIDTIPLEQLNNFVLNCQFVINLFIFIVSLLQKVTFSFVIVYTY